MKYKRITLCLIGLLLHGTCMAQGLYDVSRSAFCREVVDHEPVGLFDDPAEIKNGMPVILWMEIRCSASALTMLEAKQQMAIYHAWGVGGHITDCIVISITQEDWQKHATAFRNQMREQGYFTWRTQSYKENCYNGNWYVSIMDANRKSVKKFNSGNRAFRPEIDLKLQFKK